MTITASDLMVDWVLVTAGAQKLMKNNHYLRQHLKIDSKYQTNWYAEIQAKTANLNIIGGLFCSFDDSLLTWHVLLT